MDFREFLSFYSEDVKSDSSFMDRANRIIKDYGEGFAVFIGGRLSSFGGDVGAARHSATMAVERGAKRDDVRIRRIKV